MDGWILFKVAALCTVPFGAFAFRSPLLSSIHSETGYLWPPGPGWDHKYHVKVSRQSEPEKFFFLFPCYISLSRISVSTLHTGKWYIFHYRSCDDVVSAGDVSIALSQSAAAAAAGHSAGANKWCSSCISAFRLHAAFSTSSLWAICQWSVDGCWYYSHYRRGCVSGLSLYRHEICCWRRDDLFQSGYRAWLCGEFFAICNSKLQAFPSRNIMLNKKAQLTQREARVSLGI